MQETEITKIVPAGRWFHLDLKDLWRHRELLYFLTLRDIKVRYKQTAIGVTWALLQPVLTTAIFTVIFSSVARFETSDVPYPLFALSGLLIWLFIHTAISTASSSFVNNTNLVTKVYFPRLIMPLAATFAALVDLILSLALLVILMIYYQTKVTSSLIFAPLFLILCMVVAVAFGILFSALNVRFRDVKFALPFLLQVWMIASPVFYPASLITGNAKLLFALNPLSGILDGFRSSLFGTPFEWPSIAISTGSAVVLLLISLMVFKVMEDDFADIV